MADREGVSPAGQHDLYASQTYSTAIRSGGLLFVSGPVGSRSDGSLEPEFEDNVRLAFANLKATLEARGCGFDATIDVTTFSTDPGNQFGTAMNIQAEISRKPLIRTGPHWASIG
ncbi:Rid family hydrolase [Sphingomonas sp. UV9]|uniref:Rid family hydrolase n=1 Tax=Sphingomonas sp. UV9 TaxID=1851410 RepID=UPI001F0BADA7|nr:Rid family hydrolase [Sphingomonas sp. UV9]